MTNLNTLKVKFRYRGNEKQKTFITITNAKNEPIIETSVKRCAEDVHDKALGRFFAFRKAMNQLAIRNIIPKEDRVQVWNAFRQNVKVPKSINFDKKPVVKKVQAKAMAIA